jgi:hypothetical protein
MGGVLAGAPSREAQAEVSFVSAELSERILTLGVGQPASVFLLALGAALGTLVTAVGRIHTVGPGESIPGLRWLREETGPGSASAAVDAAIALIRGEAGA